MPKGWRVEIVGLDGQARVVLVGMADQTRAIKTALVGSKSASVTAALLSDEECERLHLFVGEIRQVGPTRR